MFPVLGIDYGKSKIGLAIAVGPLAEPLTTVSSSEFLSLIPKIVSRQSIKSIVVGFPDERLSDDIFTFLNQLEANLPKPSPNIYTYDETLSTHDAKLALMHTSPKRRKSREHAVAATIILQAWLDSQSPASVK